jgi:flagellar basal body-associated protein FliL
VDAPVMMSKAEEIVFAVVAIMILVMGIFGLDAIVFRKKGAANQNQESHSQRVRYIVEEEPDEQDGRVPR